MGSVHGKYTFNDSWSGTDSLGMGITSPATGVRWTRYQYDAIMRRSHQKQTKDQPPIAFDFDYLPEELFHEILDRLPPKTNFSELRLVCSRWEEVISNRFCFHPLLSAATLSEFNVFMNYAAGKNVNDLRIGNLSEGGLKLSPKNLNIRIGERIETISFEEYYTSLDLANISAIICQCPNVRKIIFKNYQPLNGSFNINDLVTEEFGSFRLNNLKCLEFRKGKAPDDGISSALEFDCRFASFLPDLESFHIFQMDRTQILNYDVLPLNLKVLEICSPSIQGFMITEILVRLVNLKTFSVQSLVRYSETGSSEDCKFIIDLKTITNILIKTNLKYFNCIPATLIPVDVESLRKSTNNLHADGKIVKWWFHEDYFRLRIFKPTLPA